MESPTDDVAQSVRPWHMTSLRMAQEFGIGLTPEIAQTLDPDAPDLWDKNWRDLMQDIATQRREIADLTVSHALYGEEESDCETLLSMGASSGDENFCRLLLAAGADPNHNYPGATTPLIEAVRKGHESTCRLLLDEGAKVNGRGKRGTLPLAEAIACHNATLCKLLIDAGADVTLVLGGSKDYVRQTFLGIAIASGNTHEIIRMLLCAGAHIHAQDQMRRTALILAAERNDISACELLVGVSKGIKTALLCLYRLKQEGNLFGQVLYNNRDTLLLPYLGIDPRSDDYVSTSRLLNMADTWGKRAYDYLPVEWLNPRFGYFFPYDPTDKEVAALVKVGGMKSDFELRGYEGRTLEEQNQNLMSVAKCAQPDCPIDIYGFKPKGRDFFILALPSLAGNNCKLECELMIHRQHRVNNEIFTALLCLNRLKNNAVSGAEGLYKQFRKLFFAHLYGKFSYIPLLPLVREITDGGKLFNEIKCLDEDYICSLD